MQQKMCLCYSLIFGLFFSLCQSCNSFCFWCCLYEIPNVSEHVTSQTSGQPDFLGAMVTPSGYLPSNHERPADSKIDGIRANIRDLWMMLFMAAWRGKWPSLLEQLSPWEPSSSSVALQWWHWCGWQMAMPRQRPTAICMTLSSIRSPREYIGSAFNPYMYTCLFGRNSQ